MSTNSPPPQSPSPLTPRPSLQPSAFHSDARTTTTTSPQTSTTAQEPHQQQQPYHHNDPHRSEEPPEQDLEQAQLPPPPPYALPTPLFPLVSDPATGESSHPAVHYIFADDDPELHAAALMRALGDEASSAARAGLELGNDVTAAGGGAVLPPLRPGVRERYLVVDLAVGGVGGVGGAGGGAGVGAGAGAGELVVANAQSLSPDWQVTDAVVGPAPTFATDAEAGGPGGGSLMLKVEGREGVRGRSAGRVGVGVEEQEEEVLGEARRAVGGDIVAGMEELLKRFEGGVEVLGKIVGEDADIVEG